MKRMQWMLWLALALAMPAVAQAEQVALARSPDGRIVVELDLNGEGRLAYRVSRDGKPVVVYVAPKKQFMTVKAFDDLRGVLAQGETENVERVVSELHLEDLPDRIAG